MVFFWEKNTNETVSNSKFDRKLDIYRQNLEKTVFKNKEAVVIRNCLRKIIWNWQNVNKLHGGYRKESILTLVENFFFTRKVK